MKKSLTIALTFALFSAIAQVGNAQTPSPSMKAPLSHGTADQLMSASNRIECSLERSQLLWQTPSPLELGEIPCQYLGSLGGPVVDAQPALLENQALETITIDRTQPIQGCKRLLDTGFFLIEGVCNKYYFPFN